MYSKIVINYKNKWVYMWGEEDGVNFFKFRIAWLHPCTDIRPFSEKVVHFQNILNSTMKYFTFLRAIHPHTWDYSFIALFPQNNLNIIWLCAIIFFRKSEMLKINILIRYLNRALSLHNNAISVAKQNPFAAAV